MVNHRNSRVQLYRRYKRLFVALNSMRDMELVSAREFGNIRNRVTQAYEAARKERNKSAPKSLIPRGRPSSAKSKVCAKDGCETPIKEGQRFCSRDHAPLGSYGMFTTMKGWPAQKEPEDLEKTPTCTKANKHR